MSSVSELLTGMLPSLALIVALLYGLHRLRRRPTVAGTARMRVVDRTGVTRGAMVAIVEADDRRFLVGATEHGIRLLSELASLETAGAPLPATSGSTTDPLGSVTTTAASIFHSPVSVAGAPAVPTAPAPDSATPPASDPAHAARSDLALPSLYERCTDAATIPTTRPRSGLVHRLQQMTVRTHVEEPLRERF